MNKFRALVDEIATMYPTVAALARISPVGSRNHTDGIPGADERQNATGDSLTERLRRHGVDGFTLNLHADGERITQATITIDLGPRACSAPAWPTLAHTIATTICDHLDDP